MAEITYYISNVLSLLVSYAVSFGGKIIGALLVLFIGLKIAKVLVNMIDKSKAFSAMDPTAKTFLRSALNIVFKAIVFITTIGILGVPLTSVVTVIASCGVAVGLALQGGLSNLAGGIIILIFKPFEVGNYIIGGGVEGSVETIGIFYTTLVTPDNKRVIIPNGGLMNTTVTAANQLDTRRVDLEFAVSYASDIDKVREIIASVIDKNENVLKDKGVDILVSKLDESSIGFAVRVWSKTDNYWDVYFNLNEGVKKALGENKIESPFKQVDVHVKEK